jgi:GAF domain-containing protein
MSDGNLARHRMKSIRETIHQLSSKLEEREVIQVLLDQMVSSSSVRGALMFLLDHGSDTFLLGGAVGLSEAYLAKVPVSIEESTVNRRLMAGETVVIDVLLALPEFLNAGASQEGLKGMVAVPMLIRGRVIGAVHIYYPDVLSDRQSLLLLETLADLGAMVLEKVRLQNSLYRIAEALSSSADVQRMLEMVLSAAVEEMWLKSALIRLLDEKNGTLKLVAAYGLSESYRRKRREMTLMESEIDLPVMKGETVIIHDIEEEKKGNHLDDTRKEGVRSILVVPLILKNRILGVMRAYSARPRYFSPVAVTFLRSVADLVSLAIESAELYAALESRYKDLKIDLADWHRFLMLG